MFQLSSTSKTGKYSMRGSKTRIMLCKNTAATENCPVRRRQLLSGAHADDSVVYTRLCNLKMIMRNSHCLSFSPPAKGCSAGSNKVLKDCMWILADLTLKSLRGKTNSSNLPIFVCCRRASLFDSAVYAHIKGIFVACV